MIFQIVSPQVSDEDFESDFEHEDDSADKIIGGNFASIERHPYHAAIRGSYFCSASLISLSRALTAGHCIDISVPAAAHTIQAGTALRSGDANAQFRTVTYYARHPGFAIIALKILNNIAVVHFNPPMVRSRTVRPLNLPLQNAAIPYGRSAVVVGWGRTTLTNLSLTNRLRVTEVPFVTNLVCARNLSEPITNDMVCAGWPQGGRDACQGDEGSALVINNVQLGISSWGRLCARPGIPGVYTRIPYFVDWIRSHL